MDDWGGFWFIPYHDMEHENDVLQNTRIEMKGRSGEKLQRKAQRQAAPVVKIAPRPLVQRITRSRSQSQRH